MNGNRIKNRSQVGGLHVGSNYFTCIIIIIIIMNKKITKVQKLNNI